MKDIPDRTNPPQNWPFSEKETSFILNVFLDAQEEEHQTGKYPEAPWYAMLACNKFGHPVPSWVISYFAKIAERMILRDEPIGDDYGAYLARLFGGLDGDKLKTVRDHLIKTQQHNFVENCIQEKCAREMRSKKQGDQAAAYRKYQRMFPEAPSPKKAYEKIRKSLKSLLNGNDTVNEPSLPKSVRSASDRFLEQFEKDNS